MHVILERREAAKEADKKIKKLCGKKTVRKGVRGDLDQAQPEPEVELNQINPDGARANQNGHSSAESDDDFGSAHEDVFGCGALKHN